MNATTLDDQIVRCVAVTCYREVTQYPHTSVSCSRGLTPGIPNIPGGPQPISPIPGGPHSRESGAPHIIPKTLIPGSPDLIPGGPQPISPIPGGPHSRGSENPPGYTAPYRNS